MVHRLVPVPADYRKSHDAWVEHVAALLHSTKGGAVFGLFGRWGTGKSSAVKAIVQEFLNVDEPGGHGNRTYASAYIDCTKALTEPEDVEHQIVTQVSLKDGSGKKGQVDILRKFAKLFRKSKPLAAAYPGPATAASLAATAHAGSSILDQVADAKSAKPADLAAPPESDFTLVILDDLDRCNPNEAWRLLQGARRVFEHETILTIVVCDPSVLGRHVASVLGVEPADGFAAVLKYIDVPLHVPRFPGAAGSYGTQISAVLESWPALKWPLAATALDHVGGVPIRDVLAALPQAAVWLSLDCEDFRERGLSPERSDQIVVEWVFSLSLIHTCLPNAFDVLVTLASESLGKKARLAATDLFSARLDVGNALMFGDSVLGVLQSRMDLLQHFATRGSSRVAYVGGHVDGMASDPVVEPELVEELFARLLC